MINQPKLESGRIAQAVYTWTMKGIDGSKGVGFSAISPSLEKSIDWLTRLQPPEFKLFRMNEPPPELYEARKGFSELGRTVRGDIGIAYRKTADGTSDVSGRPQPVVHVLIADAATLGLLTVDRIRPDFWVREVEQSSVAGIALSDTTVDDIVDPARNLPVHKCSDGHEEVILLLRSLAREKGDADIITPSYQDALARLRLLFPDNIVENFIHASYVTPNGIEHEIGIRLPRVARAIEDLPGSAARPASAAAAQSNCPVSQAASVARARYLATSDASIEKYAETILQAMRAPVTPKAPRPSPPPAPGPRTAKAYPLRPGGPSLGPQLEASAVTRAMQAVRQGTGGERFSVRENLDFFNQLRQSGALSEVLDADPHLLVTVFGDISDKESIGRWNRAWVGTGIDTFIELWNSTHIAAFLGIALIRNSTPPRALSRKIAADQGVSPDATARVLQLMKGQLGGGASIGQAIRAGFGGSESMRYFICRTFESAPNYLYGVILDHADPSHDQMIDYIRFGFNSWAEYRHLSQGEAAALQELLRPTFFDKIKSILGK